MTNHQCSGQGNELLLAPGQRTRRARTKLLGLGNDLVYPRQSVLPIRNADRPHRDTNVVLSRQLRNEPPIFGHIADSQMSTFLWRCLLKFEMIELHCARLQFQEPHQCPEKCRLSGSIASDQSNHLPSLQIETCIPKHGDRTDVDVQPFNTKHLPFPFHLLPYLTWKSPRQSQVLALLGR